MENSRPCIEKFLGSERYSRWRESKIYRYAVDTGSSLIFYTLANGANELLIAGEDWKTCLKVRAVGSLVNISTAWLYGAYRDAVYNRFGIREDSTFRKIAADTFTSATFGTPVYAGLQIGMGVPGDQVLKACSSFFVYSPFIGRFYGIFQDWFRGLFGLEPAYKKKRAEEELYEGDV